MADNLAKLTDKEIRLECLRLAVEFAAEMQRSDPLLKAQEYYDWVMKKNSSRKSLQTSINKVELRT
jgi:hypothetical protein